MDNTRGPASLRIQVVRAGPVATVSACGELTRATVPGLERALAKALTDPGRVVLDVRELRSSWTPALHTFTAALTQAGGWPTARLTLYGADPELAAQLERLRIPDSIPTAADAATAVDLLAARPRRVSRNHRLECDPAAVKIARALTDAACRDWGLTELDTRHDGHLCEDAALVVTELVSNAVEHARTDCRLALTLDPRGLTIAVRDHHLDPPPQPAPPDPTARRGRGLQVVAAVSNAWSATPAPDGKTVWALLLLPAPSSPPG